MTSIRTIFAGTPAFAVPSLNTLINDPRADVVAVYTQPDRRAGRGQKLSPSPVKQRALDAGLRVEQPQRFSEAGVVDAFCQFGADCLVVAAYGLILPVTVLDAVRFPINVHASALPRWRGAAPIQRAIMAGDTRTGISIMRIVQALDAGPVWLTRDCAIEDNDTGGTLHDKLASLGSAALSDALTMIATDAVIEVAQDPGAVTYAEKITAADRTLDWSLPAMQLHRNIRALSPAPGARAELGSLTLKVLEAQPCPVDSVVQQAAPGTVLSCDASGLRVATGDGTLAIIRMQPSGKQAMDAAQFANGYGGQF